MEVYCTKCHQLGHYAARCPNEVVEEEVGQADPVGFEEKDGPHRANCESGFRDTGGNGDSSGPGGEGVLDQLQARQETLAKRRWREANRERYNEYQRVYMRKWRAKP